MLLNSEDIKLEEKPKSIDELNYEIIKLKSENEELKKNNISKKFNREKR